MPQNTPDWPIGESRTRLNMPAWEQLIAEHDLRTDREIAQVLRISEPAWWRAINEESQPGTKFIRHALRAFKVPYERLFWHEDISDQTEEFV